MANAKRGRPRNDNKPPIWSSVLRLPQETADQVKEVAARNHASINTVITAMVEACLDSDLL